MKKIFFTAITALLYSVTLAQSPVPSYTNSAPSPIPGNPSQPAELYSGTNPAGDPNSKDGNTLTIPDPFKNSNNNAPQNNGLPNQNQSNPTSTSPGNSYQQYPGNSYPASPGVSTPTSQFHKLFQDPAKTSKYPNSDPPSTTRDGSTGKYRANHKSQNGHNFATRHRHIKKAKKSSKTSDKTHNENTR